MAMQLASSPTFDSLENRVDDLEALISAGIDAPYETWAAVPAPASAGLRADVLPSDAGVHDQTIGGVTTSVKNSGVFLSINDSSVLKWKRVLDFQSVTLADIDDFVSANKAATPLSVANRVASKIGDIADLSDTLTHFLIFALKAINGVVPLSVEKDGTVDITQLRARFIKGYTASLMRLLVRVPGRDDAGEFTATAGARGAALAYGILVGEQLALAINDDGSIDLDVVRAHLVRARSMQSKLYQIRAPLGDIVGSLQAAGVGGLAAGVLDASGNVIPWCINPDGTVSQIWDRAARYSGNVFIANGVLFVAEPYRYGLRHVKAYWGDAGSGQTFSLTTGNSGDHSVHGYDAATERALICRRDGDRQSFFWVPAKQNAPTARPLTSTRDIVVIGDSGLNGLETPLRAAFTDKKRSFTFYGSGGSWLTAHLAVLAGGVVPASQVGSNPTRGGGMAECQLTGTISDGSGGNGNILDVTAIASGALVAGQQLIIPSGGLLAGTVYTVLAFGTSGSTGTGGAGTYRLSASASQSITTMYAGVWTYPGLPEHRDKTIIIHDLGLDDAGDGDAAVIARIQAMFACLTPMFPRAWYVQAGINRQSTPAQVATYLARSAAIAAAIGWRHIPIYDALRANGTGSTVGPNGGEVFRDGNYGDDTHLSTTGKTHLCTAIAAPIEAGGN